MQHYGIGFKIRFIVSLRQAIQFPVSKDEHREWVTSVLQRDILLVGIIGNLRMGVAWLELDKRRRFNVFVKSKYNGQIYFR